MELSRGESEVYWQRCECLRRLHRYDLALLDCSEALPLDPASGRAYVARAMVLLSLERYEQAWEDVAEARRQGAVVPEGFVDRLRALRDE